MRPPAMLATSALHLSSHRRRQIACRPVTVSRMCERYAQTVLTFRITYVVPCFEARSGVPFFFRIFSHLRQICVGHFTLPHFAFSVPMKKIVNNFSATITMFRTLLVSSCRFHRISIACRPVINAITIIYIIRQYQCTNMLSILCISSVQAIHSGRQKLATLSDTNCQIQPNECDADLETHSTGF